MTDSRKSLPDPDKIDFLAKMFFDALGRTLLVSGLLAIARQSHDILLRILAATSAVVLMTWLGYALFARLSLKFRLESLRDRAHRYKEARAGVLLMLVVGGVFYVTMDVTPRALMALINASPARAVSSQ